MRILLISLILAGIASAQVPSLINYQGRLTNAEGEPLTGTKSFELKIFDAQTGGNLLYTETFDSVTLGEGGVYNFLFGEAGTSNAQVTETVGNGNGENLYQKILGNEDIADGTISVTDGTYTWSQESGSSNEDDFSASYSKNLRRITVNYFTDAPDDGRDISVTYRHQKTGIMGALTGGAEQWMELTVDGETQTTRQRIGAVPYALKAGTVDEAPLRKAVKPIWFGFYSNQRVPMNYTNNGIVIEIPERAKKLIAVKANLRRDTNSQTPSRRKLVIQTTQASTSFKESNLIERELLLGPEVENRVYKEYTIPLNFELKDGVYYQLNWSAPVGGTDLMPPLILEYEY